MLTPYMEALGSPAFRRRLVELIPSRRVQKAKEIVDTMHQRSTQIFYEKKQALQQGDEAVLRQVAAGKDIISTLSMWTCFVFWRQAHHMTLQ